MKILVKDIINSNFAISDEKGIILYKKIISELSNQNLIELDFSGIVTTISTFFNTSYGLLFKDYPKEVIKRKIRFLNIKEITKMQIDAVEEIAIKFYSKKGKR